jgi:cell shape-determining protein MreC
LGIPSYEFLVNFFKTAGTKVGFLEKKLADESHKLGQATFQVEKLQWSISELEVDNNRLREALDLETRLKEGYKYMSEQADATEQAKNKAVGH